MNSGDGSRRRSSPEARNGQYLLLSMERINSVSAPSERDSFSSGGRFPLATTLPLVASPTLFPAFLSGAAEERFPVGERRFVSLGNKRKVSTNPSSHGRNEESDSRRALRFPRKEFRRGTGSASTSRAFVSRTTGTGNDPGERAGPRLLRNLARKGKMKNGRKRKGGD